MHLELTGEDVTECIGGPQGISASDVPTRFATAMDPRLNPTQALEVARVVAELLG
jgi:3-deoxy-7-phosphoheptulonate synthase